MKRYIITLIAGNTTELNEDFTRILQGELEKTGSIVSADWLHKGKACDINVEGPSRETLTQILQDTVADKQIDSVVQPFTPNRRKRLLISDMDSTIIQQECIDELADFAGCKAHIAAITERAMNGELDFKAALRERVGLLASLPESALERTFKERIVLMPGAKSLVATMRKHGAFSVLVSGGFTYFTSRVRGAVGFNLDEANILGIADGKLTGKVVEPILDKEAKLASLLNHSQKLGITPEEVLAVGDGANDLPMIKAAGMGVAYHAKPTVQEQASIRINHADLTALLYIQGYREEEIVAE